MLPIHKICVMSLLVTSPLLDNIFFHLLVGSYYLYDNDYANSEGFLTPYKGVRYHHKEWGPDAAILQDHQEIFNMRHTKVRNVIEHAFGLMKMWWGIIRSASYYPHQGTKQVDNGLFPPPQLYSIRDDV